MNGEPCPYRTHAPVAVEEHEAWEIVRAAPMRFAEGRVVGLDMVAALALARARRMNTAVIAELLPAADTGIAEAMLAEG